jgi:hypothetical protein
VTDYEYIDGGGDDYDDDDFTIISDDGNYAT